MQRQQAEKVTLPFDAAKLRHDVRRFLASQLQNYSKRDRAQSWAAFDAEFSKRLGQEGWIGMTWPLEYGGHAKSALERYVVIEELLAAGAPVAAHWFADRQSGAQLLQYADREICETYLPRMAKGELFFCIGMSEPGAGSDLAAIKTKAEKVDTGWKINGSKLWSTHVHNAHFMIALVRTSPLEGKNRHEGMSQFLIDLSLPGIDIRPIDDQTGAQHFGEVFFDDVIVPDNHLIGDEGDGWAQVNSELTLERSGPERYLSSYVLLQEFITATAQNPSESVSQFIGETVADLWTLRQMSMSIANELTHGRDPSLHASIVKDLGASFEQGLSSEIQGLLPEADHENTLHETQEILAYLLSASPAFSLRGGTREILRGIIARGLGLR